MTSRIGPERLAQLKAAWPDILSDIADGVLIRDTLKAHGFSDNEKRALLSIDAGALASWEAAKTASADAYFEEAIATAYNKELDPAHARTRGDILKWACRIRNQKAYGDKQEHSITVKHIDLTRTIEAANERKRLADSTRTFAGVSERIDSPVRIAVSATGGAEGGRGREVSGSASAGYVDDDSELKNLL